MMKAQTCASCKLGVGMLHRYKHNDKCYAVYHYECVKQLEYCEKCDYLIQFSRYERSEFSTRHTINLLRTLCTYGMLAFLLVILNTSICIYYYRNYIKDSITPWCIEPSYNLIALYLMILCIAVVFVLVLIIWFDEQTTTNIKKIYWIKYYVMSRVVLLLSYDIIPKYCGYTLLHFLIFSGVMFTYESIILITYTVCYLCYQLFKPLFTVKITYYEPIAIV
jgi:hypothetical protein